MKARRQAWKVCAHPQCPQLVNPSEPCPTHGRPLNQPWSDGRDRKAQHHFRQAVLARDGNRCTRCGSTGPLVAHHVRAGYDASAGITLCDDCHKAVDVSAR